LIGEGKGGLTKRWVIVLSWWETSFKACESEERENARDAREGGNGILDDTLATPGGELRKKGD